MCCMRLAENMRCKKIAKNSPSAHHRTTLSGCIFATEACINNQKRLVRQQYLLNMSHNMANFGPLTAEIGSGFWSTPANFNRFHVLASLLQQCRSPNFARCLAVSWAATLYIHFLGLLPPWQNLATCKLHFASKSCVLLYWQCYCMALQQRASAKLCGMVQGMELRNFLRRRHSAERPSRWASADILVLVTFLLHILQKYTMKCNDTNYITLYNFNWY